jgi:uncharacterized protein (DUF305 family)
MNSVLRTSGRFGAVIALGASLVLSGCALHYGETPSDEMRDETASATYGSLDIMFAQMMIPHHEQAIEMSDLALERSSDPEILALAQQIKAAQAPEIEHMTAWIEATGSGMTMDHDMGMDGMLSEAEMTALRDATGTDFDRLYLEGMIQHHEGAIEMADMIVDSANAEARELADAIISSQTVEIATMTALLAR